MLELWVAVYCAHIASVLCYLGYARYNQQALPHFSVLDTGIIDAAASVAASQSNCDSEFDD